MVRATCDQQCTLTLKGKLSIRTGHRSRFYGVRKLVVHLAAGKPTKLNLRLPKKSRRAVLAALRKHQRVTVNVRGLAAGSSVSTTARLRFGARR